MMGGNPNYWWGMYPPSSLFFPNHLLGSSSSAASFSSSSLPCNGFADNQEHPQSLSLLLSGGLSAGDEERATYLSPFQPGMLETLEDRLLNPSTNLPVDDIKYDVFRTASHYSFELPTLRASFSQTKPASSPSSCVTSGVSNDNILDFSNNNVDRKNRLSHGSSEYNRTTNVGSGKKARVQSSSTQPPLKVRKEKLGDRITALHQLVSPFGKTDTASVLMEAIGYIRFLHGQIEALTSPYLRNASKTMKNQPFVQAEGHSVFPEDPGQLLNDSSLRRKVAPHQENGFIKGNNQEKARDLRSRGLCLAPVTCTQYVGTWTENGADRWAQGYGGGF